jgi:hypothetical protein
MAESINIFTSYSADLEALYFVPQNGECLVRHFECKLGGVRSTPYGAGREAKGHFASISLKGAAHPRAKRSTVETAPKDGLVRPGEREWHHV